eukprot:TRINITY_DN56876_c0_g1_i1.p1 TRINITY_DN56876_c0_g1~~TRINITY_DN56876_c0_g1_i1.p1  ORF type:complete len:1766 (+),score=256.00 TRINITY_DN56876_c0_g1_i1:125-5422(+)
MSAAAVFEMTTSSAGHTYCDDVLDSKSPESQFSLISCKELLCQLMKGECTAEDLIVDDDADDFLAARPAEDWAEVVLDVASKVETGTIFTRSTLQLLEGCMPLYEVLRFLSSEWAPAANAIQAMAQQRLFAACSAAADIGSWDIPLIGLLRSGASILRSDVQDRTATHLAAISGSDVLSLLVRMGPATLLVEDSEGKTPLDYLAGSSLIGEWGSEIGVLDALLDAVIECTAAFPERTAAILGKNPKAAEVWKTIARGENCAALSLALVEGGKFKCEKVVNKVAEHELSVSSRLQLGIRRVALLEALAAENGKALAGLQPRELELRLAHAESALREQEESSAEKLASLQRENRRLKQLLMDREMLCDARAGAGDPKDTRQIRPQPAQDSGGALANSADLESTQHTAAQCGAPASASPCLTALPGAQCPEREVVENIRQLRLLGADPSDLPKQLQQGVAELRASLMAAVDRLALDLYESKAHFLRELLQNADDNRYSEDVIPSVRFVLCGGASVDTTAATVEGRQHVDSYFFAANNEIGLTEADVRAICDISRSSKIVSNNTIGCKGIGWKSVFRVCNEPHVLSGHWRFRFSSQGLGMLTPQWVDDSDLSLLPADVRQAYSEGKTVFYLPLSDASSRASIETEMHNMESDTSQLLFLRRLREVHLDFQGVGFATEADCQWSVGVSSTCLALTGPGLDTVRVEKMSALDSDGMQAIDGRKHTEIRYAIHSHEGSLVAFPLVEEPLPQKVFAFLPVRPVGFRFAVHAPFTLTASRTDVHRSPENASLRSGVANAFLRACKSSEEVASRALKYLGNEPAEPFWLAVRSNILTGLQTVACVMTEEGLFSPEKCLIRGDSLAAKWVPESLLLQACGLHFASDLNPHDALHDLGIRTFGSRQLIQCLSCLDDDWLLGMWSHPSRNRLFSDIYASLAESLRENPSSIAQVQCLRIFPVATESKAAGARQAFSTSEELYSELCSALPFSWQCLLLRCLSSELELQSNALKLLEFLGISKATEAELERLALRQILVQEPDHDAAVVASGHTADEAASRPQIQAVWASLAILCRCFSIGRAPPRPWASIRNAVVLPSSLGKLVPPRCLRLHCFLGIEATLPNSVVMHIYSFTGQRRSAPENLDLMATPPSNLGQSLSLLDWEVFLVALGCKPADPTGKSTDGFVEATLRLGATLSNGEFWHRAVKSKQTMAYVESVIRHVSWQRRCWLRRLPVTLCGETMALEHLFLGKVFRPLMGSCLPYLEDIPENSHVHALLRSLGIAMNFSQSTLLKCIRWLRVHNAEDIALMADVYSLLDEHGFDGRTPEAYIFVPGSGFLNADGCCWRHFQMPYLQSCSSLHGLADHYSRFGPGACKALKSWVHESPEEDAQELCNTLLTAIKYARADSYSPRPESLCDGPDPQEAVGHLFPAAKAIIEALAVLCAGAYSTECPGVSSSSAIASSFFCTIRMIVMPDGESSGTNMKCRLLFPEEAFWTVSSDLKDHPCNGMALSRHYGSRRDIEVFFTSTLHVMREFGPTDLARWIAKHSSRPFVPGANMETAANASRHGIREGMDVTNLLSGTGGSVNILGKTNFNPRQAALDALQRARSSTQTAGQNPMKSANLEEASSSSSADSSTKADSSPGDSPRRSWERVGDLGGMSVFAVNGQMPPHVGVPDVSVLWRISSAFGLRTDQIAFGYDPTGRSVCDHNLFFDVLSIPRANLQPTLESYVTFWVQELARAVVHQGLGAVVDDRFFQVMQELVALALPTCLRVEMTRHQ